MMDIISDSVPTNVVLNVTVYDNSRGVVFTTIEVINILIFP